MNGKYSAPQCTVKGALHRLSWVLPITLGIVGSLLLPTAVKAESKEIEPEVLTWARVEFLRNRVQLVPQSQNGRRAQISDILSVGDALRTSRASRAELRFNDDSLARIGERATFRFTPDTRNFQLSNGTVLLLIPPGRGRSTIQTPNAVTGVQGSALFVRYIPETDTTIVGALTDNPAGPMVLFNRDGTEQQALRSNEIGVIVGDQITELYQFDGTLFWQSSGLAEGFNYLGDASSTGSDALDGVRQEIRDAISNQRPITDGNVITNPDSFARPEAAGSTSPRPSRPGTTGGAIIIEDGEDSSSPPLSDVDGTEGLEETSEPVLEFEDSPAEGYLQGNSGSEDPEKLGIGVNNSLSPSAPGSGGQAASGGGTSQPTTATPTVADTADDPDSASVLEPTGTENKPPLPTPEEDGDGLIAAPSNPSPVAGPGSGNGGGNQGGDAPVLRPLPPNALTDDTPEAPTEPEPSETPDLSEEPPIIPDESDTPNAPETSESTDVPEALDTPETLGGQDFVETPEVLESPLETPEASETPTTPEGPDVPQAIESPEVPETPEDSVPETPVAPEVPGTTPEVPEVQEAPIIPDTENLDPGGFNDAPAGGSNSSLILREVPSEAIAPQALEEITVPPETLDATPDFVDDPTLTPVPPEVEQVDELPSPTTEVIPMTEESESESPVDMDAP